MEIRAKGKTDYESCKAASHIVTYKKKNPKKVFIVNLCIDFVIAVVLLFVVSVTDIGVAPVVVLVLIVLAIAGEFSSYFLLPSLQYRSMSKMKDLDNDYTFYDSFFEALSETDEYKGNVSLRYSILEKVMETEKYFFIFENKRQIFVVDKSTLEGGTADELRNSMSAVLGKKCIRCKY